MGLGKRMTLNEYWRRIQAFENGETEDVYRNLRLMDYEWPNLAGDMMLNLAIPPVEYFTERIDRLCLRND
jgi:plasmid rolling circle replication initiator protein Rep